MPAWATTIRTATVARIVAAATSASSRVEDSRIAKFHLAGSDATVDTFPRVVVRVASLRRRARGGRSSVVEVTGELVIECYALAESGTVAHVATARAAVETLDAACYRALLDSGTWLENSTKPPNGLGTEFSEIQDGAKIVCVAVQRWELTGEDTRTETTTGDALDEIGVDITSEHDSGNTETDATTEVASLYE